MLWACFKKKKKKNSIVVVLGGGGSFLEPLLMKEGGKTSQTGHDGACVNCEEVCFSNSIGSLAWEWEGGLPFKSFITYCEVETCTIAWVGKEVKGGVLRKSSPIPFFKTSLLPTNIGKKRRRDGNGYVASALGRKKDLIVEGERSK